MMTSLANQRKWWGLLGISLSSFLGCIDFTIVNTGLPNIQADLGASVTQLQWIINIFLLALAAFMVIKGRLADIYGRRRLLYIGMLIFGLSSLGAGLSPSIHWLIFFRFVQGIGVAILYTVPVAIVPSLFPPEQRGRAVGILFGVNGFGLAIGPVVGGFIISALSWRWIFFVNPPIILLSFLLCAPILTESKSHEFGNKIDWLGFVLLGLAFPLLVLATVQGSVWGWSSPLTLSAYAVALVCLIIFYFVETRSQSPLLQLRLFANRVFVSSALANITLAFFYTIAFFILPLYLYNMLGKTSDQIGLTLLPATVMVAILSPVVGYAIGKFGVKLSLIFGFALLAASAFMQTYFNIDTHSAFIFVALSLLGIGWAFILSPTFVAALSALPESMGGVVTGTMGTLHNFGGAMGLALGMVLYHHQAKLILLADALRYHWSVGPWMDQVIADPTLAVRTLGQITNISTADATQIFAHFFIYSYSSLMWLLVAVSLLALVIVSIGLKNQSKKPRQKVPLVMH